MQDTDKVVDDCVQATPGLVKDWTDRMAKWNATKEATKETTKAPKKDSKKDGKDSKNWNKKCESPENHVFAKCIRRNVIVTCPTWAKSDNCDKLMAFAKTCSAYPMNGNCGKHGKGSGEKNDKEASKAAKGGKGKN